MKTQLFIPQKIKVGFNLRSDTYTGKLGYVIGHDGKVWRKEKSWEGWRLKFNSSEELHNMKVKQFNDNVQSQKRQHQSYIEYYKSNPHYDSYKKYAEMTELEFLAQYNLDSFDKWTKSNRFYPGNVSDNEGIKPVEFENVPTEGFVLNKKAGGYSTGWNHRSTYCRVYDPRGFEFEITIPNLLFILQETSAVKGKGLEGEFVYSWDGKDLVLLPAHCEEYKQSQQFTKLQSGKIGVKDLIPGCSYKTKKQTDVIYLGKFNWYSFDYVKGQKYKVKEIKTEKQHVFVDENYKQSYGSKYTIVTSLSSFASRNSDTPVSNYAELMDEFSNSKYASKPLHLEAEKTNLRLKEGIENSYWLDGEYYLKKADNEYVGCSILANYKSSGQFVENGKWIHKSTFEGFTISENECIVFKDGKLSLTSIDYNQRNSDKKYTKEQLEDMSLNRLYLSLGQGNRISIKNY